MTIKILDTPGSLSEEDLKLLAGTDVLLNLIRNRTLVIVDRGLQVQWELLTDGLNGIYHVREIDNQRLYQIWFELAPDLDKFKKNLCMYKLSLEQTAQA
jgi:hypothetical protein